MEEDTPKLFQPVLHELIRKVEKVDMIEKDTSKQTENGMESIFKDLKRGRQKNHERVFRRVINRYLSKEEMSTENLFEDLKEKGILSKFVETLTGIQIKELNVHMPDILDGNPTMILGLLWRLLLEFHISDSRSDLGNRGRLSGRNDLLTRVNEALLSQKIVKINNFGKCWGDGTVLTKLLNTIRPYLLDLEKIKKEAIPMRLQYAFRAAEDHLGIARILDPRDMTDSSSVMIYIAEILNAFPNAGKTPKITLVDKDICWVQHFLLSTSVAGKYLRMLLDHFCKREKKTLCIVLDDIYYKHKLFHYLIYPACKCLCGLNKKVEQVNKKQIKNFEKMYIRSGQTCSNLASGANVCPHSYNAIPTISTSALDITALSSILECLFLGASCKPLTETVVSIREYRNKIMHMGEDGKLQFNFDTAWLSMKKSISSICSFLNVPADSLESDMKEIDRVALLCNKCRSLKKASIGENQDDLGSDLSGCPLCNNSVDATLDAKSIINNNMAAFMGLHPDEFLDDFEDQDILTKEEIREIRKEDKRMSKMEMLLKSLEEKSPGQCRHAIDILKSKEYGYEIRQMERGKRDKRNSNKDIHGNTMNIFKLGMDFIGRSRMLSYRKVQDALISLFKAPETVQKMKANGIDNYEIKRGSIVVEMRIEGREKFNIFVNALKNNNFHEFVTSLWNRVSDMDEVQDGDLSLVSKVYPLTCELGKNKGKGDAVESSAFLIDTHMEYFLEELNTKPLLELLKQKNIDVYPAVQVRQNFPFKRRMQARVLLDIFREKPFSFFKQCLEKTQSQSVMDHVHATQTTWVMALSTKFGKVCQSCGREGKYNTMHLCYQCNGYHCEECSLLHNKDHLLIPLTTDTQTSTDHSSLKPTSPPVLESNVEGNVLYRREGEAVKSTSFQPEKSTVYGKADPRHLKGTKCLELSVKRPEDKDKITVTGVLCLLDSIVVVDNVNEVLKLFDKNGTYLSCTELKEFSWGITDVRDSTFATCGHGNTVYLWTARGHTIVSEDVSYHVDHDAYGVHYSGTYYGVLHNDYNAITILDRQGRQVREIIMKEACGKKFKFGWDIHMDNDTNNIYVPCWSEHGVLCMTVEGEAMWFIPLSGIPLGITEIQGTLCVVDCGSDCLHMITKDGEYVRKLFDKDDLGGQPHHVCHGQSDRLYVSYDPFGDKHDIISVYTVT